MSRTNVFVSYSHLDRDWLQRLQMHLSVLERKGLVDVWSDTKIAIGEGWHEEIEAALTAANVAVLLISPAFLASDYIWREEMPRIVKHAEVGMRVLPLIARPCAWRLADELARLQARPAGSRALSLGSEAQIDLELADFVLELARMIGAVPARMTNVVEQPLVASATTASSPELSESATPFAAFPRVWRGAHPGTGEEVTLRIEMIEVGGLTGRMEYQTRGLYSLVKGVVRRDSRELVNYGWSQVGPASDLAILFREHPALPRESDVLPLGAYRAFVDGGVMQGIGDGGRFVFTAEP